MAVTRYAIKTGNWSDTATWSATNNGLGGASVPTTGDTADLNSQSVALDISPITPATIRDISVGGTGTLIPLATGTYVIGSTANNTLVQSSNAATQGLLQAGAGQNLIVNGTVVNAATSTASQGFTVLLYSGGTITVNGPASGSGQYAVTNNQASNTIGDPSSTSSAIITTEAETSFAPSITINGDVKNHGANSAGIYLLTGCIAYVNGELVNDAAGGSGAYLDTGNPASQVTLLRVSGNATNTAAGGIPAAMGIPAVSQKPDCGLIDIGGNWQNYDPSQSASTTVAGTLQNVAGSIVIVRGNVDCTAGYCLAMGVFFDTTDFGNVGMIVILGSILKDSQPTLGLLVTHGNAFGTGAAETANNVYWLTLSPVPTNSRLAAAQYAISLIGWLTIYVSFPGPTSSRVSYCTFEGGNSIGPYSIGDRSLGPYPVYV